MLTLYEELFLIAMDDQRGGVAPSEAINVQYGLAGAILADLALHNKIQIKEGKVIPVEPTPIGDARLDETLGMIAASDRQRKPARWINILAVKKLSRQVADSLVTKGILRIENKRYLWVIPYEAYPQRDASAKYWVKNRLRAIVLGGEKPEPDAVALLSLIKACRLLGLVFTKDERKAAGKQVEELVKGELFGEAVANTLEEIETAAAVMVMAAAS